MEQAPDDLSGHERESSDEHLDKMTGEPMDAPEKQDAAEDPPRKTENGHHDNHKGG